jgi:hypothetical protein
VNGFAVNACAVNGSIEVWSWDAAPLTVALAGSGNVARGMTAAGSADMAVSGAGSLVIGEALIGQADVALSAGLVPSVERRPNFAPLVIDTGAAGAVIIGQPLYGEVVVQVTAAGQGMRWVLGSGEAIVQLSGVMIGVLITPIHAGGAFGIGIGLEGRGKTARVKQLKGSMTINVAALTPLRRIIDCPPGEVRVGVDLKGSGRISERVPLAGEAILALRMRGRLERRRYHYLSGSLSIGIELDTLRAGKPYIPMEYYPAPRERTYMVPADQPAQPARPEYRGV